MKALQLYEPLFQYLCELNRLVRGGYAPGYAEVRREVLSRLANINEKAEADLELREHLRVLKTPINYVVDGLIVQNRGLPWRLRWHEERLGFRKDGLAGDEAFFAEHLDPALKATPSAAGAERMLVYYTCLGLGYQGIYFGVPEKLRGYMKAMQPAVAQWLVDDRAEHLLPQAYQFTDRRDLARPPELKWALLFAGIVAILFAGLPLYWWLARDVIAQTERQIHLREISESYQWQPTQAAKP